MFSDFYKLNVKLIVLPKTLYYIFESFNIEMDFTAIKYSGQGSFRVKKETIGELLFLLKNHRHLPIASVNDPCSNGSGPLHI